MRHARATAPLRTDTPGTAEGRQKEQEGGSREDVNGASACESGAVRRFQPSRGRDFGTGRLGERERGSGDRRADQTIYPMDRPSRSAATKPQFRRMLVW